MSSSIWCSCFLGSGENVEEALVSGEELWPPLPRDPDFCSNNSIHARRIWAFCASFPPVPLRDHSEVSWFKTSSKVILWSENIYFPDQNVGEIMSPDDSAVKNGRLERNRKMPNY